MPVATVSRELSVIGAAERSHLLRRGMGFEPTLALYGLDRTDVRQDILVARAGETVRLNGRENNPFLCRLCETYDLDEFKAWIGVPDRLIETGEFLAAPDVAAETWTPRLEQPNAALSEPEFRTIQQAANCYLFGHSGGAQRYKAAIQMHLAPFAVAVYAAATVTIEAGGVLEVCGYPAAVLFEDVVLHEGGVIRLCTPTNMLMDTLAKIHA
jgi:hypothetical protein